MDRSKRPRTTGSGTWCPPLANSAGQEARLQLLPYSGQAGNYAPGSWARMDAARGRSVDVQQLRVRWRPSHSANELPREEGQFFVWLLGIWDRSENLRTPDRWRAVDMSSSAGRAHDPAIRRLLL